MKTNRMWLLTLRIATFLPFFLVLTVLLIVYVFITQTLPWYIVALYLGLLVLAGLFVTKWKTLIGMATESDD